MITGRSFGAIAAGVVGPTGLPLAPRIGAGFRRDLVALERGLRGLRQRRSRGGA